MSRFVELLHGDLAIVAAHLDLGPDLDGPEIRAVLQNLVGVVSDLQRQRREDDDLLSRSAPSEEDPS